MDNDAPKPKQGILLDENNEPIDFHHQRQKKYRSETFRYGLGQDVRIGRFQFASIWVPVVMFLVLPLLLGVGLSLAIVTGLLIGAAILLRRILQPFISTRR